jgi:hypothetical protein
LIAVRLGHGRTGVSDQVRITDHRPPRQIRIAGRRSAIGWGGGDGADRQEKNSVVKDAGAWDVINPSNPRYATTLQFHVDA